MNTETLTLIICLLVSIGNLIFLIWFRNTWSKTTLNLYNSYKNLYNNYKNQHKRINALEDKS